MCLGCWDVDERKTLLATEECDGHLTPFLTVNELKTRLIQKWHKTKKTSHLVYKEAVIDPPESGMEWTEVVNSHLVTLKVSFVNF
jgi:hypothetical protein